MKLLEQPEAKSRIFHRAAKETSKMDEFWTLEAVGKHLQVRKGKSTQWKTPKVEKNTFIFIFAFYVLTFNLLYLIAT